MPDGMLLRSPYVASNIADPGRALTLDDFESDTAQQLSRPVGLERFVDYGRWFQQQSYRNSTGARSPGSRRTGAFRLELGDGDMLSARKLVVAGGIMPFAWVPQQFRELPPELVSHTSQHRDSASSPASGDRRSAAARARWNRRRCFTRSGAEVEVLVRAPRIYFLRRRTGILHRMGPLTRLLFAPAEVGPAGVSRLVSAPDWYRRLPRALQDRLSIRSLRPAGAAWLVPRLEQVRITLVGASNVASEQPAVSSSSCAWLTAAGGRCDHLLLATGYRVDIRAYPFLPAWLLERIARSGGYPRLDRGFESSVARPALPRRALCVELRATDAFCRRH